MLTLIRKSTQEANKPRVGWISILMFVIGATSSFDMQIIGRVGLGEIIAFAFVPFFWITSNESFCNSNFFKSLALLALLFVGIIISDVVNSNYLMFSARALARPVFMLGFLLFLIPVLRREPSSINYYVYGLIIAGIVQYFRGSAFEAEGSADVTSYAGIAFRVVPLFASCIITACVCIYPRNRFLSGGCLLFGFLLFALIGAPRSSLLVLLLAAVLIILVGFSKNKGRRRIQLTRAKLFGISLFLLFSAISLYSFYIYSAPRGMLGEEARIKYNNQAYQRFGATPWGLILSGRAPVYGAILGIIERPLVGHGSWRHDITSAFVLDAIADVGADARVLDNLKKGGKMNGAGHSVLFQAWVENGTIPAISYLLIYAVALSVLKFIMVNDSRLTPYIILTFMSFSWDFLFSPPDMGLRFSVGLFLAIYTVFMDKHRPLRRMQYIH